MTQKQTDLQRELTQVREAKTRHVKAHNWEIAALYREIEKMLQTEEPNCGNCKKLLHSIGIGQELVCDLNKLQIPHSKWCCDKHEQKDIRYDA